MKRRSFLRFAGSAAFGLLAGGAARPRPGRGSEVSGPIRVLLCGDVMTGRGIDQVLPHPVAPRLHERWVRSALQYVALAERLNGRIERPVGFDYVWGDALDVLEREAPEARIINLETAVTTSEASWPDKGIHYRMHPGNVPCLTAARIDCCVLANNHVLDWGRPGLVETLETLQRAGIATAGAGRDRERADAPAVLRAGGDARVLVFALGHASSGIPSSWAAGAGRPGVSVLEDFSDASVAGLAARVRAVKRPGDVAVASIHWGGNWGYRVPDAHRRFAHRMIDEAGIDVVHGHSSHHPKGLEVYHERLILYGAGDLINDYEGIEGYAEYRDDLSLMYLPRLDRRDGRLLSLAMVPMQIRRFRLRRAAPDDAGWLRRTLDRECARFGCGVVAGAGRTLSLRWDAGRTGRG